VEGEYISHALIPTAVVETIPLGVDINYFAPLKTKIQQSVNKGKETYKLIFTGSLDLLHNEDAIMYYAEAILPLLRERNYPSSLTVLGHSPSRRLKQLFRAYPEIRHVSWVKDTRPYIQESDVFIAPIRIIGGGSKLSIYEGMAMGKAIVATTIGVEGLSVNAGKDIVIADSADSFADAIITLLANKARREEIGRHARAHVVAQFSWEKMAAQFSKICHNLVEKIV
jgi:glycosyltransferase involved in cell wall biosynthesis